MITETFKITRQWILAGKAIFTVRNDKGDHYTFKVSKVDGEQGRGNSFGIVQARPPIWFLMKISIDALMMFIKDVETIRTFVYGKLDREKPNQEIAIAMTRIQEFSRTLGKTEVQVKA